MNHKNRLSTLLLPTIFLAALVSACDDRQEKAQAAFAQYQAALVDGDLRAAQRALQQLVIADDSNADYWVELGKLSIQLGEYSAAYEAYLRAHELDRANVEPLAVLTQLALRSGNLDVAEQHAKQLEIVAPSNPAVPLTKGYVALRRGDYEEASQQVTAFNAVAPYDSSGKVLQALIYMAQSQPDQAIALLQDQIRQQPSDATSLRAIANIFELRERWGEAADALRLYLSWRPTDQQARVRLIEADLRSWQEVPAADVTLKAVAKEDIDSLLAPWVALGKQEVIADRLFEWAKTADVGRRIAVARFLATASRPEQVIALTQSSANLPVRPDNTIANALYGEALAQTGRSKDGLARLDQVLELDGANREALRARALLRSATGSHKGAIEDAQKLVSVDDKSAPVRLLVARIYAAAGDQDSARRTLWEAFHDIGEDRTIFDALRPVVAKVDGAQAAARLSQEYYDKRNEKLTRSIA
jgi:tetratricopeptide (TPR) repeat protein